MFNLQGSEIIVILLLALVVLGPEKLPDAVRRFTKTYAELKKMSSGFQSELKSALDEPMREMRESAEMFREAADPDRYSSRDDVTADGMTGDDAVASEPEVHGEMPLDAQEHDEPTVPDEPIEPGSATVSLPGDAPDVAPVDAPGDAPDDGAEPPAEAVQPSHERDETTSA